jgi:hypothetical protein
VLPAFGTPCPVHDPAFAKLAAHGHHAHESSGATLSDGHNTAAHHEELNAPTNHSQQRHHCTCVGCGDCPSPGALAAKPVTFAPALIAAGSEQPLPTATTLAPRRAEHSLPYPTAPPAPQA